MDWDPHPSLQRHAKAGDSRLLGFEEVFVEHQNDRRRVSRVDLTIAGKIHFGQFAFGVTIEGQLANLSMEGAAVECGQEIAVGELISLTFPLGRHETCKIQDARVSYCLKLRDGECVVGLHFIKFDEAEKSKLDRYLKHLNFFRRNPMFSLLTMDEMVRFMSIAYEERFSLGQVIFSEDQPADALYVVVSGVVQVSKKNAEGKEEMLSYVQAGEMFGEMSLLDAQPRSATATAGIPTSVLRIDGHPFKVLIHEESVLARKLLWMFVTTLCRRLREADKQVVETVTTKQPPLLSL